MFNHFHIFCRSFCADLLVWSNASLIILNPSEVSSQPLTSAARQAEGSLTTGPLVMLSARILLRQPPLIWTRSTAQSAHTHTHTHTQTHTVGCTTLPCWHHHLQKVLCILCWCSLPGNPLWSPWERETASHPAGEDQQLPPAPACSQSRSHSRCPSPAATPVIQTEWKHQHTNTLFICLFHILIWWVQRRFQDHFLRRNYLTNNPFFPFAGK